MTQRREPIPNIALYNLRDARGFTQQDVADEINDLAEKHGKKVHVDNVTVSRWERGVIERPSPVYRRLLAELFDVSLDELGFTRPIKASPNAAEPQRELDVDAFVLDHSPLEVEPRVQADQDRWKATRRSLNGHRAGLLGPRASCTTSRFDLAIPA